MAEKHDNSFVGPNPCQNGILGLGFAMVFLRQTNGAKPPKTWVLDLKQWIGCVLAGKLKNSFIGPNSCPNGILGPDFETLHLLQPNGAKPPKM